MPPEGFVWRCRHCLRLLIENPVTREPEPCPEHPDGDPDFVPEDEL